MVEQLASNKRSQFYEILDDRLTQFNMLEFARLLQEDTGMTAYRKFSKINLTNTLRHSDDTSSNWRTVINYLIKSTVL